MLIISFTNNKKWSEVFPFFCVHEATEYSILEICLLLKQAHKDMPILFPYRELETHKKVVSNQAILATSSLACVFVKKI